MVCLFQPIYGTAFVFFSYKNYTFINLVYLFLLLLFLFFGYFYGKVVTSGLM